MGLISIQTKNPPGVVGIISAELSRFPNFAQSLERLYVPMGTTWEWVEGVGFAKNRNEIVRRMLAKSEAQWLWFIDDDNVFAPQVLINLLDRDVPIVQPLISARKVPFHMHAYEQFGEGYRPAPWNDIPEHGLSEWDGVSSGGVLIRRPVLEAIDDPWYEEGKTKAEEPGEDLWFCHKAREAGFSVYLDSDVEIGHMTKTTIYPRKVNGHWMIDFEMSKGCTARLPVPQ